MTEAFRKTMAWAVIIVYAIALFVLSIAPLTLPETPVDPKKLLLHGIAFMILGFLVRTQAKRHRFAVACSAGYGVILEVIQAFVPYRVFDVFDLGANILGVLLGAVLAGWAKQRAG